MTATVTEPDLDIDVGFPLLCEHSQHATHKRNHGDDTATHYIMAVHECYSGEGLTVYAACEKFAQHVKYKQDRIWRCINCGVEMLGWDMCRVVSEI